MPDYEVYLTLTAEYSGAFLVTAETKDAAATHVQQRLDAIDHTFESFERLFRHRHDVWFESGRIAMQDISET